MEGVPGTVIIQKIYGAWHLFYFLLTGDNQVGVYRGIPKMPCH